MRRSLVLVLLAGAVLAPTATGAGSTSQASVRTVATGLDNPRGVAIMSDGRVAVGEAGHGGDVCMGSGGAPPCVGLTSQVSAVNPTSGAHTPIVSGLFSLNTGADGVLGVSGVAASAGSLWAIIGESPQALADASCTGQPADCTSVLAAAKSQAGTLIRFGEDGSGLTTVAGVGAFDFQWTVDHHAQFGGEIDANPYGLLPLVEGAGVLVADAGSNTLDLVGNDGTVSVQQRFPDPVPALTFPADAVPTCVAPRQGGGIFVADLAGRLWSGATTPLTQMSLPGVSNEHFSGCATDKSGNLFLVSIFNGTGGPTPGTGSVFEVTPSGTVTTLASGLNFPNMIAVAGDGTLYVTVNSVCGATGGGPCGTTSGALDAITPAAPSTGTPTAPTMPEMPAPPNVSLPAMPDAVAIVNAALASVGLKPSGTAH